MNDSVCSSNDFMYMYSRGQYEVYVPFFLVRSYYGCIFTVSDMPFYGMVSVVAGTIHATLPSTIGRESKH